MSELTEIVKQFKGNVLCIGVNNHSILKSLEKNNQANVYTIDRTLSKSIFRRRKSKMNGSKKVNMKKLRKNFKKKSVDYILCNFNEIYDYFKYFIYDSVIINRKKLYIYGDSKYIDPTSLAQRFKRYHAEVSVLTSDSKFIITVDNQNSRGRWIQGKWYIFVDSFHNLGDMISTALIS